MARIFFCDRLPFDVSEIHQKHVWRKSIDKLLKLLAWRLRTIFNQRYFFLHERKHLFEHLNVNLFIVEIIKQMHINVQLSVRENLLAIGDNVSHIRVQLHVVFQTVLAHNATENILCFLIYFKPLINNFEIPLEFSFPAVFNHLKISWRSNWFKSYLTPIQSMK